MEISLHVIYVLSVVHQSVGQTRFNGPFAITSKVIIISVEMASAASGNRRNYLTTVSNVSESGGPQRTQANSITRHLSRLQSVRLLGCES